MNTTGVFQDGYYDLGVMGNGESFPLVFLSDPHHGTRMMSREAWSVFRKWGETHPKARYIGMGDYRDEGSATERMAMDRMALDTHEQTMQDLKANYEKLTDSFCKEISFMRGRTLGLIEGNHFIRDSKGITLTQRICDYLKCDYWGVAALIRLSAIVRGSTKNKENERRVALDLFLHHGRGASRKPGGSINAVEDMRSVASADGYFMGHDHQRGAYEKSLLYLPSNFNKTRGHVQHRKQLLVRTGSFLRGYVKGESSYIADALYPPSGLGTVTVIVTMKREFTGKHGKDNSLTYLDMEARI